MRESDAGMQQSGSTRLSNRLDNATTLGKTLIKEPVREAVREALEEERQRTDSEMQRQRTDGETQTTKEMTEIGIDEEESKSTSRLRRFLGLTLGLGAAAVLVRRRKQLREVAPIGGKSSTESAAEQSESVGVETTVTDEMTVEDEDETTVQNP